MTDKELLKAIGGIDDRFIDEAFSPSSAAPNLRRRIIRRVVTLAACLAAVVGITAALGLPERNHALPDTRQEMNGGATPVMEDHADGLELGAVRDSNAVKNVSEPTKSHIRVPVKKDEMMPRLLETDAVREIWYLSLKRSTK